ncbi:unnamed protein product [Cochlearia groenlandica]
MRRLSVRHIVEHFHCNIFLKPFSSLTIHTNLKPESREASSSQDPYSLLKQDPVDICLSLWVKSFSSPPSATFSNLTGFLSKFDLWVLAYQRAYAHVTGTFPPRNAIHSNALRSLLTLQRAVARSGGKFRWNDKLNQYLMGPNEKVSANLGEPMSKGKLKRVMECEEPIFQDRVVHEVLLMIVEPFFEARFSSKSHGFRPGRNPHSVIRTVRSNFAGYLWFIKGDVSELLDHVDVDVVMNCVEKVVKDRKVLGLIESALIVPDKRGIKRVLERKNVGDGNGLGVKRRIEREKRMRTKKKILSDDEPKPDPYWLRTFYSFAPKEAAKVPSYGYCGILSPLLANVCLNEMDRFMEEKIVEYFRPCKDDSIWKESIEDGCHNPAWPEFVPSSGKEKTRKMDYIRHGGHFLIGIRGPREDAVQIRKEITEFCDRVLGLRLDNSKLEIEHISRGIQFLDHIICRRVIYPTLRYTGSGGSIVSKKGVGTLLSVSASLEQCIRQFRRLAFVKGDKDPEPLPCNPMLYSSQSHSNSQMNKFLETMADWYKYADNRKKAVGFCAYVIRSSLAKLYAARYRLKSRAKVYSIAKRDLSQPLSESSNNSAPEYSDLLRMGLVDAIEGVQFSRMSLIPSCDYTPFPRNWIPKHEQVLREYIRLQDPKFFCELHRSIKREGLTLPQDGISEAVWDFKTIGAWKSKYESKREADDEVKKLDSPS